ncbi:MAG: hypothetical protein JW715_15890 [Sedimentisphaerales bacterium]|nr:hypothetical protein [Sedimentisphaerales bacterium]
MVFRYYTNAISQASRNVAAAIFIVGLLLIGFGVIIVALPELFAYLAAGVFFVAGIGCGITAVKIFWACRKIDQADSEPSEPYRENVQIHIEEHHD